MAAEKPRLTVYDCQTQAAEIATLAATITDADLYVATDADATKLNKFDTRVQPWKEDCEFKYHRYHFVVAEGNKVQGWMLVDIRTHNPKRGRTWTYVYLDKVSVRNGTRGVGKQLGDYLKTWAAERKDIDFIWLWAIDERVSGIYETSWDYKRVQYYDGYGFMFYTILRPPPLSMLQSEPPESPRKVWVAARTIAAMNPRNEPLVRLIAEKRRGNAEGVKNVVEPLMEELNDIPADEVAGVQEQLQGVLKTGGRRRARPQTKKAAKKTCYPGYEVYNFRKNSRGVFYNCLPKKRKTRRRA
jgi:hypothetical protein